MDNQNNHHRQKLRGRRLAAWVCVTLSLLLVVGALVYSFQPGLIPAFAASHGHFAFPAFPHTPHTTVCPTPDHPTDNSTISLKSGGLQRSFIVHLPPSYGQERQAVVINYHGYAKTAASLDTYTNMGAEADQENFIVVFPQGANDGVGK